MTNKTTSNDSNDSTDSKRFELHNDARRPRPTINDLRCTQHDGTAVIHAPANTDAFIATTNAVIALEDAQ